TLAGASTAFDLPRNFQRHRVACDRLFEREIELVTQVRTAEYLIAPAAPPDAKDVAEHVAEDVAERIGTAAPAAHALATLQPRVPEPVIRRALVGVRQDLV